MRPTSGNVGQCRQYHIKSGQVENVGVEVEIALISQVVQKLLPLPFLRQPYWISSFGGRHLEFRQSATSGSVDSSIFESSMAENMGVEVGIAAP